MKKIFRIGIIGILHTTVYLWLIPMVIIPRFGENGAIATTITVVVFSIFFLFFLFTKKEKKEEEI